MTTESERGTAGKNAVPCDHCELPSACIGYGACIHPAAAAPSDTPEPAICPECKQGNRLNGRLLHAYGCSFGNNAASQQVSSSIGSTTRNQAEPVDGGAPLPETTSWNDTSPTPETDDWEQRYSRVRHWTNFARKLERERNSLREEVAGFKEGAEEDEAHILDQDNQITHLKSALRDVQSELTATKWALESANAHLVSPEEANDLRDKLAAMQSRLDAAGGELPTMAWDVYIPSRQHGYVVDSEDDKQMIDDVTNCDDTVVTELCEKDAATALLAKQSQRIEATDALVKASRNHQCLNGRPGFLPIKCDICEALAALERHEAFKEGGK